MEKHVRGEQKGMQSTGVGGGATGCPLSIRAKESYTGFGERDWLENGDIGFRV